MDRRHALSFAVFALLVPLMGACSSSSERAYRAQVPPNLVPSFDRFASRCSKCHSLSRPLESGIASDEHWAMYVERMRLQPGSGISTDDARVILDFLRFYAEKQRQKHAGTNVGVDGGAGVGTAEAGAP